MAKVICAMSGGIDSSVAAALLKRAGFDVIGVFMKFWSEPSKDSLVGASNRCCSPEAELRARKVAKILKIPFYVFDFSKEFKKKVVDYFLKSLKMGETPNPCVICNKEIKFGILLKKALNLGLDYVATGHYARVKKVKNEFHLFSAKDKEKDQSYFLWMLNQRQLSKILFPIGNLKRKQVENLAQKFNLPVLDAKKSVEICFVRNTLNDFLKKYLKEKPGKIVDQDGKILGEHRGLWFYTIGQRKGLFLPKGPWWVLKKDLRKNLLIVTKKKEDLLKKDLICHKVNWIGKISKFPLEVLAKIRYQSDLAKAKVFPISNQKYKVEFSLPQRAITAGQSIVFYKKDRVLGGGIICGKT